MTGSGQALPSRPDARLPAAIPCTGNQTYSYDSRACGHTCLSLSDRAAECHPSTVPVEGCNCPEGTYLNHKAECVRKAQCPCFLDNHKLILAGQSTVVEGVIWCVRGLGASPARCSPAPGRALTRPFLQLLFQRAAELPWAAANAPGYVAQRSSDLDHEGPRPPLSPPQPAPFPTASCSAPKTFQSCSQSSRNKFGAACAPTCQMLATGTPCVRLGQARAGLPQPVWVVGGSPDSSGEALPPAVLHDRHGQWGWEAQQLEGTVLGGYLRKVGWGPNLGRVGGSTIAQPEVRRCWPPS